MAKSQPWKLGFAFLIVAMVIAVGGVYATFQSRYILEQEQRAEYSGLQQSANGVVALATQRQNVITIALSDRFFNTLASAIAGKTLRFTVGSMPDETISLTIVRVSIQPQPGTLKAEFDLQLSSDKREYSVGLRVGAVAYFAGTERVPASPRDAERFSANFKFIPVEVTPSFAYGPFNLIARRFVSEVIDANIIRLFLDQMKAPLLYNPRIKYTLDQNGNYEQHFGDTPDNAIHYRISHQPVTIEKWIRVNPPIFTSHGILLSATLSDAEVQSSIVEPTVGEPTAEAQLANLRAKIAASDAETGRFYSSEAITVDIKEGAISEFAKTISADIQKLRFSLQSTAISGRFIDKKWRDDILGDGGFFAEAAGGDRLHGSVSLTGLNLRYQPGSGLSGSLGVAVSADADLHVHVDPLIGGGIGTTVKLVGSAATSVAASIHVDRFQFEGTNVTFAAPVIACTPIELTVQTDGKLVIAGGWVNVPSIGIRSGQLIGKDALDPTVLSGVPSSIPIVSKTDTSTGAVRSGSQLAVTQGLYLTSTIAALEIQPNPDGYRISTSQEISISNNPSDVAATSAYIDRLNKAAQQFWQTTYKPNCPAPPDLRVLVGDLEFGPNNEIIKFIRNAWNDITKGPGKNNEIVKLLNRINAGVGKYDEETKKLANQVAADAQKTFGGDQGVGHAAGEVAKSVTITVTNPPAAAAGFVKQLFNGFK